MRTLTRLLTSPTAIEKRSDRRTTITISLIWLVVLSWVLYLSFFVVSSTGSIVLIAAVGCAIGVAVTRRVDIHRDRNIKSMTPTRCVTTDDGTPERWDL